MLRLLFEKRGKAVWISHLDLMRLFQRAFKRAALPLTHTQGFNPRPSVSIALPLSVGVESVCELLDFELEGMNVSCEEICSRLNRCLVEGVRVLEVYPEGKKLKYLSHLQCALELQYDHRISQKDVEEIIALFARDEIIVEKKSKNGLSEQNIAPLIQSMNAQLCNDQMIRLQAVICCQNPSLNPMQLPAAIQKYLPALAPDQVLCCRQEIFDTDCNVFR